DSKGVRHRFESTQLNNPTCHPERSEGSDTPFLGRFVIMKPLLLILLLIPFACFGQNNKKDTCCNCAYENEVSDLGIGLVDGAGIADIFNDSLLKHKAEHVESESSKFNGTKFCPKFFKPGYSIMLYVCLAKTA